jgi:nucleoside-diphosphate-sugar epimerase
MSIVAVTGATGFIGRHLLEQLCRRPERAVRALAHGTVETQLPQRERLMWVRGDLADTTSLSALLEPGCNLIHLAFPGRWSRQDHLGATARLASMAAEIGVRRVLHCSTAAVVGCTPERRVTEETTPLPATEYEAIKLELEKAWRDRCSDRVELVILRPTAVFGPGGRNLLKLAESLTTGSRLVNYLRSSLFGRRRMNLVPVQNVIAAFEFLLDLSRPLNGESFIVSDDEDPLNNFRDVERRLMDGLAIHDYLAPPFPVPRLVLSGVLALAGRSNTDPGRIYDGQKLARAGFTRKPYSLDRGLREFATWVASGRPQVRVKTG